MGADLQAFIRLATGREGSMGYRIEEEPRTILCAVEQCSCMHVLTWIGVHRL